MSLTDETTTVTSLPPRRWTIDQERSKVGFAIKHMAIKTLHGSFLEFEGAIDLTGSTPYAGGSVRAASVHTGEVIRDEHLRESGDFFDVEHHPEISFRSRRIEPTGERRLRIEGELTMRGVTGTLVLEGDYRERDGSLELELGGELNRKDYGLTWNQSLDAGGALLGNRVKIELELTARC